MRCRKATFRPTRLTTIFQYSLTQPVTIHKNESAMVPILQQELPAEHVTLWSQQRAYAAARRVA